MSLTVLGFSNANAQDQDTPFSFSASAGYEYDSNLNVEAIDTNANTGDNAVIFDASVGFEAIDEDNIGLNVGYNYYQSKHDDIVQFDMQIHGFNGDVRYSMAGFDYGLMYLYNSIKLGSDPFLKINTIRPNVGYLMGSNKVYLTAAYEYQKHNFQSINLQVRDATRGSISGKALFLFGNGRTLNVGYTYSDHDALDDAFSYKNNIINLSLKLPFDMMDREIIFRTGYKFSSKNYGIESLIFGDEERSDQRHTIRASIEVPIMKGLFGKFEYENINSISTLATVDYRENVTTASLGWKF